MDKMYKAFYNGTEIELEESKKNIKLEGYSFKPEVFFNGKYYSVFLDGREIRIEFKDDTIFLNGKEIDFDFRASPRLMAKKNLGVSKGAKIEAAIPGKIVELKVGEGDEVVDQQCILVLESMKMRNEILSPINGIIERVAVSVGDQVKSKQLLMKIKVKK